MAVINGTHNHDILDGTVNADIIHGFAGDDSIDGGEGADVLYGDEGNDSLSGEEGSDILIGGTGNDSLWGGEGSDTYSFDGFGWGQDVIYNSANGFLNETDVVQFGSGIMPSDITVSYFYETVYGYALMLSHGEDRIIVANHFSDLNGDEFDWDGVPYKVDYQIDGVRFMSDNTFWDKDDLYALAHGIYGNHAPVLTGGPAEITVKENTTAPVATFSANDEDGDELTWSLSLFNHETGEYDADGTAFWIDPKTGVLTFVNPPDYENPTDRNKDNIHVLTIHVSDGKQSDERTIRVRITDVPEALQITSNGGGSTASVTVAENGKAVTTVKATGTDAALVYSIVGGADKALFRIDPKTGVLAFIDAPDYEKPADEGRDNIYDVQVKVSDGGSLSDTQALEVAVTDVTGKAFRGTSGADKLRGTPENDTLDGKAGADKMLGGRGDDIYVVDNSKDKVTETAGEGVDLVKASVSYTLAANVEDLTLTGSKAINGTGNGLANMIIGNSGKNTLKGGAGNDTLDGGRGNDKLYGGGGDDILNGGVGADTLYGGKGSDTFVFKSLNDSTGKASGRDTIKDFSRAEADLIDLSAIDADTRSDGDQAFEFIGTDSFHKTAGELRYEEKGGDTYVHGDVDGDGKADFTIRLDLGLSMTQADFIL